MAYKRIVTQDGVTVMNKDLYDNLQDGIDESKQAVQDLEDNVEEQFKEVDTELQDSGGIKFDGERDMIMIKNPFTGEWIDWQSSGKIIFPSTITVTTPDFGGKTVTCAIGGKTYTTEFSIISGTQGVAVFTVYEDGEAVITCESYSVTVTIQEKGNQNVSVSLKQFIGYHIIQNGERNTDIEVDSNRAVGATSEGRFKIDSSTSYENMYYGFVLDNLPQDYLLDKIVAIQGKFNICLVQGYYYNDNNVLSSCSGGLKYDGTTTSSPSADPKTSYESQEVRQFSLSSISTDWENNIHRIHKLTLRFYISAVNDTNAYLDILFVGTP